VQGGLDVGYLLLRVRVFCFARAAVLRFCLPCDRFLSCAPLQVRIPMLWICTTVQQGHGRRLSSALRAGILQLHRSGTWLCSLGVAHKVRCSEEGMGGLGGSVIVACVF
jgi:hypothetical protein